MAQWENKTQEISMDGFQVVSGDMFVHQARPGFITCTLWNDSLVFGKPSITALNNCENIRIEVNIAKKSILVTPVTSNDRDKVRWITNNKTMPPRKLLCREFSEKLYEAWKWNKEYVYRAKGRLVTADNKIMILYDFAHAESWKYKTKGNTNE